MYFKNTGKQQQTEPKISSRDKIVKIGEEIKLE